MAVSGVGYAITLGIYVAVAAVVFLLFGIWRSTKATKKFFQPKRYMDIPIKPTRISTRFGAWVPHILRMTEMEVIAYAGVDAAMYIQMLKMGMEIFAVTSLLVCIIILPINLTGTEVDNLIASSTTGPVDPGNPGLWWVPSPPPPAPPGAPPAPPAPEDGISAPKMYNDDIPPAPPGLIWWSYLPTVPPLSDPETLLGPAYSSYGWQYDDSYTVTEYKFTDLDKTTLANISDRSARMYAHAIVTWAISLFCYYSLWKYCKTSLRLRTFFLLNSPPGAETHTVLVTDIPGIKSGTIPDRMDGTLMKFVPKSVKDKAYAQLNKVKAHTMHEVSSSMEFARSITAGGDAEEGEQQRGELAAQVSTVATSIDPITGRWEMPDAWERAGDHLNGPGGSETQMVSSEFNAIYKDAFVAANMAYNTSKLDKLVATYEKTLLQATDLLDHYIFQRSQGHELKPKQIRVIGATMGKWGRDKYGMKPVKVDGFEFYKDRLTQLKEAIDEEQLKAKDAVYSTAFVTFNSRASQVVAARTLMHEDLGAWRCQPAPGVEEMYWPNLFMRQWERTLRSGLMWAAYIALALLFMIPVVALQGLISTTSLVSWVQDIPIVNALFASVIPTLALRIFLALLPLILTTMCKFAGMISESQIDLGLFTRFFIFQVLTVYFGSFIAGVFANQLKQFIEDPGSIITVLGTAAPQAAIFFLTYMTLQAFLTVPISILRIVPLIIFWIKSKLAGTERAKARLWQNQTGTYGTNATDDTIAILIGLSFSVMCPLVAPVTLIYFFVAYSVRKYNWVYVYQPPYNVGGLIWTRIFNQCIFALFMLQLMMVAVLAVKESIGAPIIVAPLLIITIYFQLSAHSTFWRPMECLSLISAAELDKKERDAGIAQQIHAIAKDLYVNPSFKVDQSEHEKVLEECARMQAVVNEGAVDDDLFVPNEEEDGSVLEGTEGAKTSSTVLKT